MLDRHVWAHVRVLFEPEQDARCHEDSRWSKGLSAGQSRLIASLTHSMAAAEVSCLRRRSDKTTYGRQQYAISGVRQHPDKLCDERPEL